MGKTLDRLLALAESQVGYTEKDSDKDLDAKVGTTAGSGNHTKYARDLTTMGLPGYCGSAWCAVYQMWLEVQIVGKEQALKNMGPQFYNCFAIRDYAKEQKKWIEPAGVPMPGYLVIFRQSHVGRIVKVTATKIYTNEGNTSNGTVVVRNGGMVCNKSYDRGNSSILGYVMMDYPEPVQKSGWQQTSDGWRFYLDGNRYVTNDWYLDNGKWYWFNGAGFMVANTWYEYNGDWYYLGADGAMLSGLQDIAGKWYYLDRDGKMAEEPVILTPDQDGALQYPGLAG